MQHIPGFLSSINAALRTFQENPIGAVALVALVGFVVVAYIVHKLA